MALDRRVEHIEKSAVLGHFLKSTLDAIEGGNE